MPIYQIDGMTPVVPDESYVHPTAVLIGDVILGKVQVVIPYQPPIPTAGCLIYTVNLYYAIFEVKIQVDCFKRRNLPPAFPIINHGIKLSKGFLDASHLVDKSRLHGLGSHQNSAQVPGQHLCIMHQLPQLVIGDIGMV